MYTVPAKGTSDQLTPKSIGMFQTKFFCNLLLMFDIIEHSFHLKILSCIDLQ